jgi:hypothetical protein
MSEFYDNDFERFLQQQVKQHRMYPSDAVWKGIYKQIHGDKKWPGLYFVAILIVAALSVCTIFMDSSPIIYPQAVAKVSPSTVNSLDPVQVTNKTLSDINDKQEQFSDLMIVEPVATLTNEQILPENRLYTAAVLDNNPATGKELNSTDDQSSIFHPNAAITIQADENLAIKTTQENSITGKKTEEKPKVAEQAIKQETEEETKVPVLISKAKTRKLQYQVYITPATNFKQTVDRKPSTDQFSGPMVTTYGVDANQVIRYKPGMGIEFGVGALYDVSNRFTLRAGLQYNVRQYNIEAYDGSYEVSSISLVSAGGVNKVPTLAKYRSSGANYNEALLLNKYHQVSLPVGIEYAVISRDRVAIKIGGSVQPTYTFSESAYLLTSDYKSYADGTSMIRRWNVNSSLEATLNMKVGDFQWKFGPQIRYQHLSTYTNQYPIKEYLIDYGFKIGFTKTIQ